MALAAPFPAARPVGRTPVRGSRPRPAADRRPSRSAVATGVARPSAGSLRLTRRGRLVLGVGSTLVLLAVVLFSGFLTAEAGSSLADQGRATGVVVVQPGESLWQIAQGIAPDADPRETVTRIRELNGLGEAPVVPGQSIIVPVVGPAGA